MEYSKFVTGFHKAVLERARETYGNRKQLSVAAEELDELAILCNKYQRYDSHHDGVKDLYTDVVGEVSDVLIVLNHIIEAFGISEEDLSKTVSGKIARLESWLNSSKSLQISTVMRDIPRDKPGCEACLYKDLPLIVGPCRTCGPEKKNYREAKKCNGCAHKGDFKNFMYGGPCWTCINEGKTQFEPIKEG